MTISVTELTGRVLAGRYRLRNSIGAGGGGRVFVADDVRLRRLVAVKVLHPALADDAGFLRRFRTEAQMAASLHHPHVMTVYDWGEDTVPFMVLELLSGGSLRSMLDRGARLTPSQATHIGRHVASALEYAHDRGLVHRDVKPANLLFDEHGIVRVADFGLARALAEASWTEPAGAMIGTARYAAPEQATGVPLDGRADLYSLALVLVESVTGEVPFAADTPIGTLAARTQHALVAPEALGSLGRVIERAGRPDRDQRYPDAGSMGAALADSAKRLPPPGPLTLAGLDGELDDPHPTRLGKPSATLFDQDAPDEPDDDEPAVEELVEAVRARSWFRRRVLPPGARRAVPAVVAAVVVMAIVASAAIVLRAGTGGATVAAPPLVGLMREDAATRASDAGVLMRVEERESDDPAGVVMEQDPPPGAWLHDGDTVRVVVSTGPPDVDVPEIAGLPGDQASQILLDAGFAPQVELLYDNGVADGLAIGTDPPFGEKAAPDSSIRLLVSQGPEPVAVPNVADVSYEEAAAAVEGAGFVVERRDDFHDTTPVNIVIGTEPAIGELVQPGATVTIVVSKGPELIAVPDVDGLSVEAASQALEDAGFEVDVVGFSSGATVRAQDPEPGTPLPRGSTVTLFVL